MKKGPDILRITSLTQQHSILGLKKPEHPLISIHKFEDFHVIPNEGTVRFINEFYTISIKKGYGSKVQYGQTYYDFDEGAMSFISAGQILLQDGDFIPPGGGWLLSFHPDLLKGHALSQKIKSYGFFHYAVNEALILSEKEQTAIVQILKIIQNDYCLPIDDLSNDLIVAQLELLLIYCDRYYKRQFNTRKTNSAEILTRMEILMADYFMSNRCAEQGAPTVTWISEQLGISPKYLSDLLRNLTGESAQQHIQNKVIEKAKELLLTTNLTISEIAYQLGFEYPQSFNKGFRKRVDMTPLKFRQSTERPLIN